MSTETSETIQWNTRPVPTATWNTTATIQQWYQLMQLPFIDHAHPTDSLIRGGKCTMILNGIQVLQLIFDPFAGIPVSAPPQQPTKLLDPLLASRSSVMTKETIADRHLRVAWRVTSSSRSSQYHSPIINSSTRYSRINSGRTSTAVPPSGCQLLILAMINDTPESRASGMMMDPRDGINATTIHLHS